MASIEMSDQWAVLAAQSRAADQDRERRDSPEAYLAEWTGLSLLAARDLVRSGAIELPVHRPHTFDIGAYLRAYGAGHPDPATLNERNGTRDCATLDTLDAALGTHGLYMLRDVLYQWCGKCREVQAFLSATPMPAQIVSQLRAAFPRAPHLWVHSLTPHAVTVSVNGTGNVTMLPKVAAAGLYTLHEYHACVGAGTVSDDPDLMLDGKYVDMTRYQPERYGDDHMRLSSLVRCPLRPTRHLDVDGIVVDAQGNILGLLEESADPRKAVAMTSKVAGALGVPYLRLISSPNGIEVGGHLVSLEHVTDEIVSWKR